MGMNETLLFQRGHLSTTQEGLETAQARQRKEAFEANTVQALCLVNNTNDLQGQLRPGLALCEQALATYGVLEQDDWQERTDWQRLPPTSTPPGGGRGELLVMLARGRARLTNNEPRVLREGLLLLDRAEAIRELEPSRVLWMERAAYHEKLGEEEAARRALQGANHLAPSNARDYYQQAVTHAMQGHRAGIALAIQDLDRAISSIRTITGRTCSAACATRNWDRRRPV